MTEIADRRNTQSRRLGFFREIPMFARVLFVSCLLLAVVVATVSGKDEDPCWIITVGNNGPGSWSPGGGAGGQGDLILTDLPKGTVTITQDDWDPDFGGGFSLYLDRVHPTRIMPARLNIPDILGALTIDGCVTAGEPGCLPLGVRSLGPDAGPNLPANIEAFDGHSFELRGESPPGEATLRDFYGVNLATGQVEVSLPTGMRFTGVNGDDFELKINIRTGVQRNGNLGKFAAFNYEDFLVINKLIPLDQESACSQYTSEQWKVRDLVNSSPFLTRVRGGATETWTNAGDCSQGHFNPTASPYFSNANLDRLGIVLSSSAACKMLAFDKQITGGVKNLFCGLPQTDGITHGAYAGVPFGLADPVLAEQVQGPAPWTYNKFVASPGRLELLFWNCEFVAILDSEGTMWVYKGFYKTEDRVVCPPPGSLPHNGQTDTLPPGSVFDNSGQQLAQIQLVAPCIYRETRDGLRTYYLYNKYGQHVGFRDPLGREVVFAYGSCVGEGAAAVHTANKVQYIVDQFGRRCDLVYDGEGNLSLIVLPAVESSAPGQEQLDPFIKLRLTGAAIDPRPGQMGPKKVTGLGVHPGFLWVIALRKVGVKAGWFAHTGAGRMASKEVFDPCATSNCTVTFWASSPPGQLRA